ncbi:aliphatic sulfonate ABC transporter substrate-binding protein [Virgibacillus sp. MSJ-26]|uniref:aliphatic sulfonate ABC transporter substrate-binding protein n=1 Tax=Virgibacillus sp. MSJ-26 TaxID=2841522 RepID=UPI001C0FE65A|nr:aliphatic sulfonate ABC transporter substrate-binding protein [Virgibacillus sp. MSJ-26]MBU5467142.1 aliphatic sulfonate ABC transporter substrate-binding protein [Virgibacillus sp. MSJ-26]
MRHKIVLLWSSLALLMLIVIGCSSQEISSAMQDKEDNVIRIGYQKNGPLVIVKSLGSLDEKLESRGYDVEWKEFQEGPALVEALNAGSIDIGRTGNSPVIFAQAAEASFVILAAGKSKFHGSGILVRENSNIKQIKDLKGKEIGFAKGSSSHFLLVKALEQDGLNYEDIIPAFLTPGDARVAFEQGNIDAIVVWDPFTASTEINSDGKMLVNGEGLSTDRDFFIATESFAVAHADIADMIINEVTESSEWANNNHDDLILMLAPILNIDEESIQMAVERRTYGVDDITEEIIEEQQEIADTFYELNIIPKEINVRDVME